MKEYILYRVVIQLIEGAKTFALQNVEHLQTSTVIGFYKTKQEILDFLKVKDFNYPFAKYKTLSKSLYKSYMNEWSSLLDITAEKVLHMQEISSIEHINQYANTENLHITLYMVLRG